MAGDQAVLDFFRQYQGADTNHLASMRKKFHRLLLGSPEASVQTLVFASDENENPVILSNPSSLALSPEQKKWAWATCAVLTERNHASHDLLGGCYPTRDNVVEQKTLLAKWWGVSNRDDLLNALEWIDRGGHREEFNLLGKSLAEMDKAQIEAFKVKGRDDPALLNKIQVVSLNYKALGRKSILGWDYSRYVALCGWGYVAGYLDENEAWEKIMPVARRLQTTFDSWEDLGNNYMIGRVYWSLKETVRGGTEMQKAYEKLYTDPASPWRRYPWKMPLGGEE